MTTFIFEIPGEPTGKGRPRYANIRGMVRTYTPKKTRDYERHVQQCFRRTLGIQTPLEGPVSVEIRAAFAVPESLSAVRKRRCWGGSLKPTKKPDADNIAKTVLDALNGLAYRDDASVVSLTVEKHFVTEPDEIPHVAVTVRQIGGSV